MYFEAEDKTSKYEERIILVKANSTADAVAKAQSEALEYCNQHSCALAIKSLDIFFTYPLDLIKISDYELILEDLDPCVEIFSQLYNSDLGEKDYLNKFYPEVADGQDHNLPDENANSVEE